VGVFTQGVRGLWVLQASVDEGAGLCYFASTLTNEKILAFVLFFPGFLFSLSFHEAAHGWMASKFGDFTAQKMGRVTLNPLPHMDPIGTLLLPIMGFFMGGIILGWGIPVPVDYRNLKSWKRDGMFIAAAGPISNMILALVFAAIIHLIGAFYPQWLDPEANYNGYTILMALVQVFYLNIILALFNLIPVNPLDGGKIIYGFLPRPFADQFDSFMSRYGFTILLVLLFSGVYKFIIGYPLEFIAKLLL
jgi:Zn-dependent protease